MASHKLMCITAALLILEGYGVYGQAFGASASATEFVNQGVSQTYTQTAATAAVPAPTAQFVIPAVIKPIFQETIYPQPAPMPSFPTYPPTFPPPPPVIITDDSDDMHPLLLLMLLMNSANGGNNGYTGGYGGYGCGGNCGCNGGCNGGCGGYNGGCGCNGGYGNGGYGNGGCGCNVYSNNYTPYPINVPGGPYYPPIAETPCACAYGNDVIIQGPGPVIQPCNRPMPNEINLIISAVPCNCSSSS